MKRLLVCALLLGSISAHADLESDIQKFANQFEEPKAGVGSHSRNGVSTTKEDECYVGLRSIDQRDIPGKILAIMVGSNQSTVNFKGWNANGAVRSIIKDMTRFKISYKTKFGCEETRSISFSAKSATLEKSTSCRNTSNNRSERMICNF